MLVTSAYWSDSAWNQSDTVNIAVAMRCAARRSDHPQWMTNLSDNSTDAVVTCYVVILINLTRLNVLLITYKSVYLLLRLERHIKSVMEQMMMLMMRWQMHYQQHTYTQRAEVRHPRHAISMHPPPWPQLP